MSINARDLLEHVIKPTLEYLGMASLSAEKLLVGTAAEESGFNPFFQHPRGLGIYQISSVKHRLAWDSYLAFHPDLASKVRGLASQHQFLKAPDQELTTNLAYSTAIAWIIYLQSEHQLPEADDVMGLSHFWQSNFGHQGDDQANNVKHFAQWISANVA